MANIRIGHGFDVHAFDSSRKLILGGIEIAEGPGLAGHSDADVLLHALTDAILGASARGDIGQWFPDTDETFKDADSGQLLLEVWKSLSSEGWQLVNCDVVVMAQTPKLSIYSEKIKARIAKLLSVDVSQIGIKATTTESLGFVGRKEGIACSAVCLLSRKLS
ncbi:UNVERIFIED_CONTAM: hypothetical protein GTU68_017534 [Idotea baltica]|nr:hypothetical protein [Idotea baltica]